MSLCIMGTCAMTQAGSPEILVNHGESPVLGALFVCFHAVGQASYVILQPSLLDAGYTTSEINGYAFVVASVFMALMMPFPQLHHGIWWENSAFFIGAFVYSVLMVGCYSYV